MDNDDDGGDHGETWMDRLLVKTFSQGMQQVRACVHHALIAKVFGTSCDDLVYINLGSHQSVAV